MTLEEALKGLGLDRTATRDTIKAAYRALAKKYHADTGGADADEGKFRRVHEAYQTLISFFDTQERDRFTDDDFTETLTEEDRSRARTQAAFRVREYMYDQGLVFRSDGSVAPRGGYRTTYDRARFETILAQQEETEESLLDAIRLANQAESLTFQIGDLRAAIAQARRSAATRRRTNVLLPLLDRPPVADREKARDTLLTVSEAVFTTGEPELDAAILSKFIHQIKSKALYRPIQNHLCPAITGRAGGGKSTFAVEFCSPLQELMSPPVVISDLVDPRSGELFGYPVIFLDDLAHLIPKHFEILNSVITGARLARRKLGTNKVVQTLQRSIPIVTSNKPTSALIPDITGAAMRRFGTLPFRGGNPHRGGDPKVFDVLDRVKPLLPLIWRSVDVNEPAELDVNEALFAALVERQEAERPRGEVEAWAEALDLDSREAMALRSPAHGYSASGLYSLFARQTGSALPDRSFSAEMRRLASPDYPNVPFGYSHKKSGTMWYPLKAEYVARKQPRRLLALAAS